MLLQRLVNGSEVNVSLNCFNAFFWVYLGQQRLGAARCRHQVSIVTMIRTRTAARGLYTHRLCHRSPEGKKRICYSQRVLSCVVSTRTRFHDDSALFSNTYTLLFREWGLAAVVAAAS